jgi:hypothetical protein
MNKFVIDLSPQLNKNELEAFFDTIKSEHKNFKSSFTYQIAKVGLSLLVLLKIKNYVKYIGILKQGTSIKNTIKEYRIELTDLIELSIEIRTDLTDFEGDDEANKISNILENNIIECNDPIISTNNNPNNNQDFKDVLTFIKRQENNFILSQIDDLINKISDESVTETKRCIEDAENIIKKTIGINDEDEGEIVNIELEDDAILHDIYNFRHPYFEETPKILGTKYIIERKKEGEKEELFIIEYTNRKKYENFTGIDIYFYNYIYDSFFFIQYKKVSEELKKGQKLIYRINSDFYDQIEKMEATRDRIEDLCNHKISNINSYRLSNYYFYFKLFPSKNIYREGKLIEGKYLPIEHIKEYITRGERDGEIIVYDGIERHLSNTEFISLLSKGLIGSQPMTIDEFHEIVKQLKPKNDTIIAFNKGK